jgi:hypothetical protein
MLAAIAAAAFVVGVVGATVSVTTTAEQTMERPHEAVVDVQAGDNAKAFED